MINFIQKYFQSKNCMINIIITFDEKIILRKILVSEKELSDINFEKTIDIHKTT